MFFASLKLIIGLAVLVLGGELLVRGASRLAGLARVSPLLIGLTVVAFGTSAPELAVALRACWAGESDVAMGNILGSNIANVLLILGLSAAISPLAVASKLVRFDVPVMILASFTLWALCWDGVLGRGDGIVLVSALTVYLVWSGCTANREHLVVQEEFSRPYKTSLPTGWLIALGQLVLIAMGLLLLTFGSRWLVDGAVFIASYFGVNELVIGLTIVAGGTSLPELVTSLVAAVRGERDIAVGNIVGSNLFNILCVGGLTSVVVPGGILISADALYFDFPVMIAVAIACFPVFFTGSEIARWEGLLFFAYYIVYTVYLVVASSQGGVPRAFHIALIGFALPLTLITLVVSFIRAVHARRC